MLAAHAPTRAAAAGSGWRGDCAAVPGCRRGGGAGGVDGRTTVRQASTLEADTSSAPPVRRRGRAAPATAPQAMAAALALVPSSAPAAASLLSTGGDAPVKAAPVATQTSAIGIINPPPDIRSIVVRTPGRLRRLNVAEAYSRGDVLRAAGQDRTVCRAQRPGVREAVSLRLRTRTFAPTLTLPVLLRRAQHFGKRTQQREVQLLGARRPLPRLLPAQGALLCVLPRRICPHWSGGRSLRSRQTMQAPRKNRRWYGALHVARTVRVSDKSRACAGSQGGCCWCRGGT